MSNGELAWGDLESVIAEPAAIARSAMDDLESGRCGVASDNEPGGRCTRDAEYKTTIALNGQEKKVPLCEEHATTTYEYE